MISLFLQDAIVAHLQATFRDYTLNAKGGGQQQVKVFSQYLPQPRGATLKPKGDEPIEPQGYGPADIEANFPCVVVKLIDGQDREEGQIDQARTSVNLLIGVYDESPDCQGYRDVMNIIETTRQSFLSLSCRILGKKYKLELPMKWSLFEEQPWPFYFGVVEMVWDAGRPMMRRNFSS
ncbi:MAG: hypothetical protein IJR68_11685 [Fretibacterium sp.]|nr:hypothetical protein [Fretibacterium sp.]